MKTTLFGFACLACLSLIPAPILFAQPADQVRQALFREASETFEQAGVKGVPFFSPTHYLRAKKLYQAALSQFEEGGRLNFIREHLRGSIGALEQAFESTRATKVLLASLLVTRQQTIELAASKLAGFRRPEYFTGRLLTASDFQNDQSYFNARAEEATASAIQKSEMGDLASAKELAAVAEKEYRMTSIRILKGKVLKAANHRIMQAKDTLPENTLIKAQAKMAELDLFLEDQKRTSFEVAELSHEIDLRIQNLWIEAGLRTPFIEPRPVEPLLVFTEGKETQPTSRSVPDGAFPKNIRKKSKKWSETFSMKYSVVLELGPSEKKSFPFETENSKSIFVKVLSYGQRNHQTEVVFSLELFAEGQRLPYWTGSSVALENGTSLLSAQVKASKEVKVSTKRMATLVNRTNQPLSAELWIGAASVLE